MTEQEYVFTEGSMWEGYPWKIFLNCNCTELGGKSCKHCHSHKDNINTKSNGGTWTEKVWICPRVVVAYNEGECNSTGVCLDCILDAERSLPPA